MERELIFSATRKDFKLDWFSGTGAGGQHRNKHKNCVRITHIPSGLTTQCQEFKERPQNQKVAFKKLVPLVADYYIKIDERERIRNDEIIRTYHQPDNRVKDHASGFTQSYDEVVGRKDLENMILARLEEKLNNDK